MQDRAGPAVEASLYRRAGGGREAFTSALFPRFRRSPRVGPAGPSGIGGGTGLLDEILQNAPMAVLVPSLPAKQGQDFRLRPFGHLMEKFASIGHLTPVALEEIIGTNVLRPKHPQKLAAGAQVPEPFIDPVLPHPPGPNTHDENPRPVPRLGFSIDALQLDHGLEMGESEKGGFLHDAASQPSTTASVQSTILYGFKTYETRGPFY